MFGVTSQSLEVVLVGARLSLELSLYGYQIFYIKLFYFYYSLVQGQAQFFFSFKL